MREIRFRAWDKENNKMLYMWNITCAPEGGDFQDGWFGNEGDDELEYRVNCQIELMQYTGLKDKNGQEIYEGDIVRAIEMPGNFCEVFHDEEVVDGDLFEVFYSACYFALKDLSKSHFCDLDDLLSHQNNVCCEVIGNIYENPELLKED